MIDLGLLNRATKAIEAKPRRYVTPAVLVAVVMQESGGVPYFIDSKPGSLMAVNINDAISHPIKHHDANGNLITIGYLKTGLTYRQILELITIPDKVGDFNVPAVLRGKPAKFRFEPAYWNRNKNIEDIGERFIYSCSWGLCQFMAPNISKKPDAAGLQFIRRFAADVDMQLLYAAGMIDDLLASNHNKVDAMYRAYNSGNSHSTAPAVVQRAQSVADSATKIQQFINERTAK